MRNILVLLFSFFVLSCNSAKKENDKLFSQMQSWEKLLIIDSDALLDSLMTIDKSMMSDENEAYYYLLTSMAKERSGRSFRDKDEENMDKSLEWYRTHDKEGDNYCKALLYKGIAITSNGSKRDTIAYEYILKADSVYQEKHVNDKYTLAKCYEYKSRILKAQNAYPLAEIYLGKALKATTDLNDSIGILRLKTKLFRLYLSMGKLSKAFQNISEFQFEQNPSPLIQYELSYAFYIFYSSAKDTEMAVTYLKRMIEIARKNDLKDIDYANLNYRLAIYYELHGPKDSTSTFYLKALDETKDSLTSQGPTYFSKYASFLAKNGQHELAYKYQKEGYDRLRTYSSRNTHQKLLEIDNKSEILNLSSKLEKAEKYYMYLISIIIILILGLMYLLLRNRFLKNTNISAAETESKDWLICEINRVNSSAMPRFIEEVFDESEKCRRHNPDFADKIQKSVKTARDEMKLQYSQIVDDPRFIAAFPYVNYLKPVCSPIDILMLVLIKSGLTSKEIAQVLSIQYSSVRARRSKIKDAITESGDIPEEQKQAILF